MKKYLLTIVIILILLAGIYVSKIIFFSDNQRETSNLENTKSDTEIGSRKDLQAINVELNNYFYNAVNQFQDDKSKFQIKVSGMIVLHHDLAGRLVAEMFKKLQNFPNTPTKFIVLGPNHSNLGIAPAISAEVYWQTPLGRVEEDGKLLSQLNNQGIIFDFDNFEKEYSVSAIIPFIKNYFPTATVAPIIFTSGESKEAAFDLAEKLADYIKENNAVLIASIDFSHYLNNESADIKDKQTLQAIESLDYDAILKFNSDNLDSPAALVVFLRTMELLGIKRGEVMQHTNSAQLLNNPELESTTSYFSMVY